MVDGISAGSMGKRVRSRAPANRRVQPFLIGPITDTLRFYADLFLAKKLKLAQVG